MVNVNVRAVMNTINMEIVRRVALQEKEDNLVSVSVSPTIFGLMESVELILVLVVKFGKMVDVSLNVLQIVIGLVMGVHAIQGTREIIIISV